MQFRGNPDNFRSVARERGNGVIKEELKSNSVGMLHT